MCIILLTISHNNNTSLTEVTAAMIGFKFLTNEFKLNIYAFAIISADTAHLEIYCHTTFFHGVQLGGQTSGLVVGEKDLILALSQKPYCVGC